MARTYAALDITRREMTEPPLRKTIRARDINPSAGGLNRVFKWPHSQIWTLQPIQATAGFSESRKWEAFKLRLSDFNCNKDFWKEQSQEHDKTGEFDYFLNYVVPADKAPKNYPYHQEIGGGLLTVAAISPNTPTLVGGSSLQNNEAVHLLTSKQAYAYNQGFCLRFYLEGRAQARRGSVLQFAFGEYLLCLNSTGMAELYLTPDFVNYVPVYAFRWSASSEVHSKHHRILIRPGGRNQVEFVCGTETAGSPNLVASYSPGVIGSGISVAYDGGGVFTIPGEVVFDTKSKRYIITASAPISLYFIDEYRPLIQVSLLAYTSGSSINNTPENAFFYDTPVSLPFPPLLDFTVNVDYDANGGSLEYGLYDTSGQSWHGGKDLQQFIFACTFHGSDPQGVGYCFASPEFYKRLL